MSINAGSVDDGAPRACGSPAATGDLQDARGAVVFVKGDPDIDFQWVAKAIDIAHGAGIDKVGLMTAKMLEGR